MPEYAAVLKGDTCIKLSKESYERLIRNWKRNAEQNLSLEEGLFLRTSDVVLIGPKSKVAEALGMKLETIDQEELADIINGEIDALTKLHEEKLQAKDDQIQALQNALEAFNKSNLGGSAKPAKQNKPVEDPLKSVLDTPKTPKGTENKKVK